MEVQNRKVQTVLYIDEEEPIIYHPYMDASTR